MRPASTLLHSPSSSRVVSSPTHKRRSKGMGRKEKETDDDGNVRVWWCWPCVSVTLGRRRRSFLTWTKEKRKKDVWLRAKTCVNHLIISDRHSVRLNNHPTFFLLIPSRSFSIPHQVPLFVCVFVFVLILTALAPAQHRYAAIIKPPPPQQ